MRAPHAAPGALLAGLALAALAAAAAPAVGQSSLDDYYAEGARLYAQKRYAEAAHQYTYAIHYETDKSKAYVNRGNTYLALLRYQDALADYDEAVKSDKGNPDAFLARGTLRWLLGDLGRAETDFRRAVELEPDDQFYYDRLATVLGERKKDAEILRLYREAFAKGPTRSWALWGWLGAIAAKRDWESLRLTINTLFQESFEDAAINYYAGVWYAEQKNDSGVVAQMQSALDKAPEGVPLDAWWTLANAHRRRGNIAEFKKNAHEYFERTGIDFPGLVTRDVPKDLVRKIRDHLLDGDSIRTVVFTADSGWLVVYGKNGLAWSPHGIPTSLIERLRALNAARASIKSVAIAPNGGWVVLSDVNDYWTSGVSRALEEKLEEVKREPREIRWISFADSSWVFNFAYNSAWYVRLTDNQKAALNEAVNEREGIRSIQLGEDDGYAILTLEGYRVRGPRGFNDQVRSLHEEKKSIDLAIQFPGGGWLVYSKQAAGEYHQSLHHGMR